MRALLLQRERRGEGVGWKRRAGDGIFRTIVKTDSCAPVICRYSVVSPDSYLLSGAWILVYSLTLSYSRKSA